MTLDAAIVQERLRLMRALLADLDVIGDVSAERLNRDRIVRHAVERIVSQLESFGAAADAGAISKDLAAELAPSAGLRNVLTHEYVTADLELVARAVPAAYAGFRQ